MGPNLFDNFDNYPSAIINEIHMITIIDWCDFGLQVFL